MNRGSDAMTGILLAVVGIGILVAWRSGILAQLVGLSVPAAGAAPSSSQYITRTLPLKDSATALSTGLPAPLAISPRAGGSGSTGTVDNGFSSTWVGSASYAAFRAGERTQTPAAVVSGGGAEDPYAATLWITGDPSQSFKLPDIGAAISGGLTRLS